MVNNNGVLKHLEPKKVFHYFEEICCIPHGSGNIEQISNYLVEFAVQRNLRVIQDDLKNVIIWKEGTDSYKNKPTVIIQGHMDMVAVKKNDCDKDLLKEGLTLAIDDDDIYSVGTSLGGDDGIALAYALALLDSTEYNHPPLEVVFTVDEETGMGGALGIDLSFLVGKQLLNIDSEEEGVLLVSCAGGVRLKSTLPIEREWVNGQEIVITIDGLLGGHSGLDINKGRANSNCLMGYTLGYLMKKVSFTIVSLQGGTKDNVIPSQTQAIISTKECIDNIQTFLTECQILFGKMYGNKEGNIKVTCKINNSICKNINEKMIENNSENESECAKLFCQSEGLTKNSCERVIHFLMSQQHGVHSMSEDVPDFVVSSSNLAIVTLKQDKFIGDHSIRSSLKAKKVILIDNISLITSALDGSVTIFAEYPAWEYRSFSPLRDKMVEVYKNMYGTSPRVEGIHAGLECGILCEKIKNLDCISFGPNMKNIHTAEEKLSISSVKRVWEYLLKVLES